LGYTPRVKRNCIQCKGQQGRAFRICGREQSKKADDIQQPAANSDATTNINNSLGEKSTTESENKNDNKTTSASKKKGSSGMVYGFIGALIILASGGGYFVWRKRLVKNKINNKIILIIKFLYFCITLYPHKYCYIIVYYY